MISQAKYLIRSKKETKSNIGAGRDVNVEPNDQKYFYWLMTCSSILVVTQVTSGFLFESLSTGGWPINELSFVFVTSIVVMLVALLSKFIIFLYYKHKFNQEEAYIQLGEQEEPVRSMSYGFTMEQLWIQAAFAVMRSITNTHSMVDLVFLAYVLSKAFRPLVIMLFWVLRGKKYPMFTIVNTLVIVAGASLFLSKASSSSQSGSTSDLLIGLIFVTVNVLVSSLGYSYQEVFFDEYDDNMTAAFRRKSSRRVTFDFVKNPLNSETDTATDTLTEEEDEEEKGRGSVFTDKEEGGGDETEESPLISSSSSSVPPLTVSRSPILQYLEGVDRHTPSLDTEKERKELLWRSHPLFEDYKRLIMPIEFQIRICMIIPIISFFALIVQGEFWTFVDDVSKYWVAISILSLSTGISVTIKAIIVHVFTAFRLSQLILLASIIVMTGSAIVYRSDFYAIQIVGIVLAIVGSFNNFVKQSHFKDEFVD